tara:strand:- start:57 stop:188 length:132 start_codon:yes stop_codon:yes gene_type:complete
MIYDIIMYCILFIAAILIVVSCSNGSKVTKANKKLEDKMDNLK